MRRRARAKPAGTFVGIDRCVSPSPLQHMAPQRPLDAALIREAGQIMAEREGWKLDPDPPRGDLARLEVRTAERDRALELLDRVERLVARIGGFMTPVDQDLMREVRETLAEAGCRVDERPLWTDRR